MKELTLGCVCCGTALPKCTVSLWECLSVTLCAAFCLQVLCLAVLSSQLWHDLSVRPLSLMSWSNTQGWEVNWKQDVVTVIDFSHNYLIDGLQLNVKCYPRSRWRQQQQHTVSSILNSPQKELHTPVQVRIVN